jgi:8-oxo-dGTP pyrophosphatase MutT (NUDIX family)
LVRELREELGIQVADMCLLTRFEFDLTPIGLKKIYRVFYEVQLPVTVLNSITLGEGAAFKAFTRNEILTLPRLTPYDGFALWFHANAGRLHA